MDPQEWLAFINLHGGIIGHIPYRTKAEQDGTVDLNPKPPMNLNFKDGSSMQAIFEDDGSVTVTQGLKPGKGVKLPTAPKEIKGPNGEIYSENPDGTLSLQTGPDTTPTPRNTVPGTGTPGSGNPADPSGPRYQAPTPDLPVDVYGAQTARATQEETARQNALDNADRAAQRTRQANLDAAKAEADRIQAMVESGKLSNAQAIAMFDASLQAMTFASNEGDNAVKYAQAANANRVGPGFGQHFADALSGRGVNFTGADFTYPTPDYAAIARKGAAAALAHLSPYAASIAGTMAPPGGYAGSGGAYAGPAVTDAANSVAGGASASLAPGVTRDAQGNLGFIAPDGRFIQAQTTPAPPQLGYGAYRPGG